ncbi:HAD-IA family hydrolase [Telmatospirillum sp.]|uniref:HAD family hydrolase n=1 Tax=Telmatospirillum sp. TaxID=2079197 RepID=UPI002850BA71|nr:HAD-IA family hydrolase [Telmatospirillum sp.]MDR3435649.1 HAD-IA family hydrolase [Telmatospirillum sp.]
MTLRALLFDLDGTLIHSDPLHFEAFRTVSAKHGVDFDEDYFSRQMSGHTNAQICATLFPALTIEQHQQIADEKEALFRSFLADRAVAIPGIVSATDWALAHNLRLAVVSNAPSANIAAVVKALGLDGRFSVEICGGMVPRGKPDPMPYQAALDRLLLSAGEAVAFEDTPLGIRAAVGAGIATVGLTTTQSAPSLVEVGASLVIGDYHDPLLLPFLNDRRAA